VVYKFIIKDWITFVEKCICLLGFLCAGPWRWFDESMLDCCEPLETVKARGISFGKLVCLAHCAGAKVDAFHASQSSINDFRKYVIKCSTSDDCHVISSYHRAALKQVSMWFGYGAYLT
jgi:glutathione gamma-glutamylcysteinyltransferase